MSEKTFIEAIRDAAPKYRGRIGVDVGCNHGRYTKIMSLACSVVIAFEPHAGNAAYARNYLLDVPNVVLHEMALADKAGVAQLWLQNNNPGGHTIAPSVMAGGHFGHDKNRFDEVRVETLDAMVQHEGVGMIKIDVEGAEERVLRGAERVLRGSDALLLLEVHQTVDLSAIHDFVVGCGYEFQGLTKLEHDTHVIAQKP